MFNTHKNTISNVFLVFSNFNIVNLILLVVLVVLHLVVEVNVLIQNFLFHRVLGEVKVKTYACEIMKLMHSIPA